MSAHVPSPGGPILPVASQGVGSPPDPATMAHAMQQLHAQMTALQQQVLQQTAAHAHTAAQPTPAAPRVERPRLPPPAPFDGKSAALDEWAVVMQQQFDWYASSEAEKLRMAVAFQKGAALDWWTNQLSPADRSAVATWDQFVAALRKRFQPVTTAELARVKLSRLEQGKASIHEYVAAFRRLIIALPAMEEGDRLFAFTRGLKPSIATQLRIQGVKRVDEAIEMAVRVGTMGDFAALASSSSSTRVDAEAMEIDNIEGVEGLEPASTDGDSAATPASKASPASASGSEAAVTRADLHALIAAMADNRRSRVSKADRQGRRPAQKEGEGLTAEEMREHLDSNRCFYCHKTGHRAVECRRKMREQGK
jgi:Retrotransposon gag protein